MRPILVRLALLLAASGCATAGSSSSEPSIPVYPRAESVPCAFEEVEDLYHRMTLVLNSGDEYDRIRDRELARLGAEAGADAVILLEQRADRPVSINVGTPMTATFEGTAIRFLEDPCGTPGG